MTYTVLWTPRAEQQLAEIWLNSDDRDAISQVAHAIDKRLRVDAHRQGESRELDQRVLFCPPLTVYFRVLAEDRTVYVLSLFEIRRRI